MNLKSLKISTTLMALLLTAPTYATQIEDITDEFYDDPQIHAVLSHYARNPSPSSASSHASRIPELNRRLTSKGELAEPEAYTRGLHARLNLLSATIKHTTSDSDDEEVIDSVAMQKMFTSPDGKSSVHVRQNLRRSQSARGVSAHASTVATGQISGPGAPWMAADMIQQLLSEPNTIHMTSRTTKRDGSVQTTSKKISVAESTPSSLNDLFQSPIDPLKMVSSAAAKFSVQTTAQPKSTGQQLTTASQLKSKKAAATVTAQQPTTAPQLKSKKAAATVTAQQPASSSSAQPKATNVGSTSSSNSQLEMIIINTFLNSLDQTTNELDGNKFIKTLSTQLASATQNPHAKADEIVVLINDAGRRATHASGFDEKAFAKDLLTQFAQYQAKLPSAQSSSSSAQPKIATVNPASLIMGYIDPAQIISGKKVAQKSTASATPSPVVGPVKTTVVSQPSSLSVLKVNTSALRTTGLPVEKEKQIFSSLPILSELHTTQPDETKINHNLQVMLAHKEDTTEAIKKAFGATSGGSHTPEMLSVFETLQNCLTKTSFALPGFAGTYKTSKDEMMDFMKQYSLINSYGCAYRFTKTQNSDGSVLFTLHNSAAAGHKYKELKFTKVS